MQCINTVKSCQKSISQELLEMFNQYPTVKENSFVPKHPSYSVWLWVTACSVCEVDWNLVYFEAGRENSIDTSQLPPSWLAMSRHGYDTINESQDSIVVALRLPCSAESKLLKWWRSCFRSLAVHHAQTLHTHLLVASLSRSLKTCPRGLPGETALLFCWRTFIRRIYCYLMLINRRKEIKQEIWWGIVKICRAFDTLYL